MGVRLVRYTRSNSGLIDARDHDELINRDLMNQHPIYAITGLQEVLNILEDANYETNVLMEAKEVAIYKKIDGILEDIAAINQQIIAIGNFNVIKKVEETYTLKLEYDETTKTLKGNVKVFTDKDDTNAIQVLADGLYVPKTITEETSTVKWTEESLGETLEEIYQNGMRFSHNTNSWSNMYSAAEANAWYWDSNLHSFVQPKNTSYFNGFVTQDFYDYYTHTVQLRSTDSDNDVNGVVIGFVIDENGHPHTLTALCERTGWTTVKNWALVYDFYLPDQQVLFRAGNGPGGTTPSGAGSSGWNKLGNGITVRVTKHRNIVTAACSNWNSAAGINEATTITIDLNNYSWGHLFQGAVRYGYCNISQAKSFFQNIEFHSENAASASKFLATVKVSEKEGNEIVVEEDGIYAPAFVISAEEGNALSKKDSGYYVEGMTISKQPDNAIQKLTDGLYVREYATVRGVNQVAHGFTVGDFIYYHPFNKYQKASAVDDYDANIVGMVTKIIDVDNFEYQWSGFYQTDLFTDDNGFTQGMPLYISDTEPGKTTQEQPDISKAVGYPVENIGLVISIERGIQYNMEASIGDFKTSANTYNVRSDGFIKIVEDVEYKQTLITRLLDSLDDTFKASYLVFNDTNQTVSFINTDNLYIVNKVPEGLNLFIKAF